MQALQGRISVYGLKIYYICTKMCTNCKKLDVLTHFCSFTCFSNSTPYLYYTLYSGTIATIYNLRSRCINICTLIIMEVACIGS